MRFTFAIVAAALAAGIPLDAWTRSDLRGSTPTETPTARRIQSVAPPAAPLTALAAPAPTAKPAQAPAAAVTPDPRTRLDEMLDAELAGSGSCVLVIDDGSVVASYDPTKAVIPASTQKVLTAAAALELLGPSHRFTTKVAVSDDPSDGVVQDVWLIGGGDPALATPAYASYIRRNPRYNLLPPTDFVRLADALAAAGVRQVQGRIWADESHQGAGGYLPTWKRSYIESGTISPMGALNVNQGWRAWAPEKRPVSDPAIHSASKLAELLQQRGVVVHQEPKAGKTAETATEVGVVQSAPLVDIVRGMLNASDNVSAEMLAREVGRARFGDGTTGAGVRAIHETLDDLGVDTSAVFAADGSGLERRNRLSCKTLTDTLSTTPGGANISDLLATAGGSGTLWHRYTGTPAQGRLHAKTGWIYGVVGLTGKIDGPNAVTFALVQNGNALSLAEGRVREARIVDAIMRYVNGTL